jgi:hypothetical protein
MIDVLSTVFKTKEHTAHVRVVGNWSMLKSRSSVPARAYCPSMDSQAYNKLSMLEQIPLTMVQKLAQPKKCM